MLRVKLKFSHQPSRCSQTSVWRCCLLLSYRGGNHLQPHAGSVHLVSYSADDSHAGRYRVTKAPLSILFSQRITIQVMIPVLRWVKCARERHPHTHTHTCRQTKHRWKHCATQEFVTFSCDISLHYNSGLLFLTYLTLSIHACVNNPPTEPWVSVLRHRCSCFRFQSVFFFKGCSKTKSEVSIVRTRGRTINQNIKIAIAISRLPHFLD